MTKVYFDTNVLVAALKPDHVHHVPCLAAYSDVLLGAIEGYFSSQGLSEFYSVATRTPFVVPIHPLGAVEIIERSIMPHFHLVDLNAASYRAAISECASRGWRGGRVHDAVHLQAATQAKCDLIYTYDLEHFQSLAPEWGDRIRRP